MISYDAIIIGAGQAGIPLAYQLAERGWRVALIERAYLGGSCINYGCTPTKTMIASAKVAQTAREVEKYGVRAGEVQVDLSAVVARKNEVVGTKRANMEARVAASPNITPYWAEARFTGPHTVEAGGETLTAEKIFINTGSRPLIPQLPGLDQVPYLTNLSIIDLKELPEHLLIIGGGYIGLEFGQMFRRFGSRVTIVHRNQQIVPREDPEVAQALQEALESEGVEFRLGTVAQEVSAAPDGGIRLVIQPEDGEKSETLAGSHLLIAAGRAANTDALNLEAAGIETRQGWVVTDEFLQTNVPGVYAMGDVTGGPAFTHISYNDYQIVSHNLFNEKKKSVRDRVIPYAIYTDPELGRVGLTEKEAIRQGYKIKVGSIPMSYAARAVEMGRTAGLMKLVVDAETDCILGAAILGESGGELVHTIMALMMAGAPWTVLYQAVYIHPTLSEGFYSLMDSVAASAER